MGQEKKIEHHFESDDESGDENRIGDVPVDWYEDHGHVGYNPEGAKLPRRLKTDEISRFLHQAEDPEWWKKIYDEKNQRIRELSQEDLQLIQQILGGGRRLQGADEDSFALEHDDPTDRVFPANPKMPRKETFLVPKGELKRIQKFLRLVRAGLLKDHEKIPRPIAADVWGSAVFEEHSLRKKVAGFRPLAPPKPPLPGHDQSYFPPEEELLGSEEEARWREDDPEDREREFFPERFSSLRQVPAYKALVQETYQRHLDLFLCPRTVESSLTLSSAQLLPILPDRDELKPFPTRIGTIFRTDGPAVLFADFHGSGSFVAVADVSRHLEIFETESARKLFQLGPFSAPITCLCWHPHLPILSLGLSTGFVVLLVLRLPNSKEPVAAAQRLTEAEHLIGSECAESWHIHFAVDSNAESPRKDLQLDFLSVTGFVSCALSVAHAHSPTRVCFHRKGGIFCVVCPGATAPTHQCVLHSLRKKSSFHPFRHMKGGKVRAAAFHPVKPFLLIATDTSLRIFDLTKREESKAAQEISTKTYRSTSTVAKFRGRRGIHDIEFHSSGEHFAVAASDGKFCWYDQDLGATPYKILQACKDDFSCVAISLHNRIPLSAVCNGDGSVSVLHSRVFDDAITNTLLIPVKKLRDPTDPAEGNPTACWHPSSPWLLTGFPSGVVALWV